VSLAKKPSTALSHEADVGVKWKVQRGWRSSQLLTLACLWVAFGGQTVRRTVWFPASLVEDDVDNLAGWDVALERVEEADEFLMAVALHVLAHDRPSTPFSMNRACQRQTVVFAVQAAPRPAA